MNGVPFDSSRWTLPREPRVVDHLGRECVTFDEPDAGLLLLLDDVQLRDGFTPTGGRTRRSSLASATARRSF